ncbi:MBL fold metallo-hydrolase [Butyrivibrio sp. XPD2002]|uniref:MBL fold metallo-hydrolase n=1 Tax=Butyrivibrio sp. XPD2002 TaxID=1280665 RepID=UPI0004078B92|nr:MBL fold metallo-hydrolase [Butyrivibrio sp. XPD2002]
MELKRQTEHIWYMPFETERDRPNLGYVKGDNWSLAIDAGHSEDHTKEFYTLLQKENLPLPSLTVLTHWHWDHTFGMHAVNGLCISNEKTNEYLAAWKEKIEKNGPGEFLSLHESIRHEYAGNTPVVVTLSDMIFKGSMELDLGGIHVKLMETPAPHTDDSTLIYVCEDKVLFIGDCAGDDFFTGNKSEELCRKLADNIKEISPEICVEGHWVPVETSDTLADLTAGI